MKFLLLLFQVQSSPHKFCFLLLMISGRECIIVSVDNDILDWSWQLTVTLNQPHPYTSTILHSNNSSTTTTVIDNEGTPDHNEHMTYPEKLF